MSVQSPVEDLDFLGVRARVLAEGFCEMIDAPPGQMPPLHVHHTHDEGFYVVAGELTLYMPGEELTLRPGDFFLAPRGIPHVYRVSSDGPARWLATSHPAGFERFVAHVASLDEQDRATVTEVAAEYGIEILGPPGAMP